MCSDLVIGAGPLGRAVFRQLSARRRVVHLATRSGTAPGIDAAPVRLDLRAAPDAASLPGGIETVYLCSAPAYWRWPQELPPMVDAAIALAARAGATLVFADNLYAYGPGDAPLTEDTPMAATGPKGLARRRAAERLSTAHAAGTVSTAIVRASDFYGPGVERAMLGLAAFRAVRAGKPVACLGDPDQLHSMTYIEDFAATLIDVGANADCHGQVWHVPTAPARSLREMVGLIGQGAGRPVRLRVAPRWLFRTMGLFSPALRELGEVYYQYTRPWLLDSRKAEARFGRLPTAPELAIRRTLDSLDAAAGPGS